MPGQIEPLKDLLTQTIQNQPSQLAFRHGCCVGWDERAVVLARSLGYWVIGHPPLNNTHVSKIALELSHELVEPKEYLQRNRDIVDVSQLFIAGPYTDHEVLRSGTWAAMRYARSVGCPMKIVNPDGTIKDGFSND